jgi:alpha-tubulin suppressor-like RCC1 family protein
MEVGERIGHSHSSCEKRARDSSQLRGFAHRLQIACSPLTRQRSDNVEPRRRGSRRLYSVRCRRRIHFPMRFLSTASRAAIGVVALLLSACSDTTSPLFDYAIVTPGDTLFSSVVSGSSHSCALTREGRAYCWGMGAQGQLGIGTLPTDCPGETPSPYILCANVPTAVAGGLRFTRLSAGGTTTCGLTPSQRLYCWGTVGGFNITPAPRLIAGSMRFTDVSAGITICAIGVDHRTYCWGSNTLGILGIPPGTPGPSLDEATPVAGDHRFTTVQSADRTVCGATASGEMYCWGAADTVRFELGGTPLLKCVGGRNGTDCTNVPLRWRGTETVSRPATSDFPCLVTAGGGATCWGLAFYEWGINGTDGSKSFDVLMAAPRGVPLALPTPIRDIVGSPGLYGACAHAVDGRVVCWGSSVSGQFGTGIAQESFALPTIVAGGRAFEQLSAGSLFTCGLTSGGEILCWGDGRWGVLGTGTAIPIDSSGRRSNPTPTRIASIAGR